MASEPFGHDQTESEPTAAEAAPTRRIVSNTLSPAFSTAYLHELVWRRSQLVSAAPEQNSLAAQALAAEDGAKQLSVDEDAVLAASQEFVWESIDRWAQDSLGEPGAHLADIRRRLAGV